MTNHTQCTMRKAAVVQISWIPSEKAVEGKFLKLRDRGGEWEDGWEVIHVGTTMPTKSVMERQDDYKRTREASDI